MTMAAPSKRIGHLSCQTSVCMETWVTSSPHLLLWKGLLSPKSRYLYHFCAFSGQHDLTLLVHLSCWLSIVSRRNNISDARSNWACLERGEEGIDVATGMNYGVASPSSWSKCTCNRKISMTRIRGPSKTTASMKRWTLWTNITRTRGPLDYCLLAKLNTFNGREQVGLHVLSLKGKLIISHMVHRDTPTMIGWVVRCTGISSVKEGHPS